MRLTERQQQSKDRHMRDKYKIDLIQPIENRFKLWYPKQYEKMEKAREQQEIKQKKEKKSKDDFFKKYRIGIHNKEMRNTLKLEEKLDGRN